MVALTVWVFGSFGLAQPVNDAFTQRTLIPGTRAVAVASLEGATVEPGEPNHDPSGASGAAAHSVWWTWTAPAAGLLSLDASASGVLHPRLRAYAGGDLAALELPPGLDEPAVGQDQMRFSVITGQRLAVVLFTRLGDVGRAVLSLQFWPAPANDNFDQRTALEGRRILLEGTTLGAGVETNEAAAFMNWRSVWYTWTAPADGELNHQLLAPLPGASLELNLYAGNAWENLQEITPEPRCSGLSYPVRGGVTYAFRYYCWPNTPGFPFATQLRLDPTPWAGTGETTEVGEDEGVSLEARVPNIGVPIQRVDYLVWDQVVASATAPPWRAVARGLPIGEVFVRAEVYDAGNTPRWCALHRFILQPKRPPNDDHDRAPSLSGDSTVLQVRDLRGATLESGEPRPPEFASGTVWWRWTAPRNGRALLTTEPPGALAAMGYVGTGLADLRPVDVVPAPSPGTLVFDARAGTTYSLQIGSRDGSFAPLDVRLTMFEPPANDNFAQAIPLPEVAAQIEADTRVATAEALEPGWNRPRSLWWSFTAPTCGWLSIRSEGIPHELQLGSWVQLAEVPATFGPPASSQAVEAIVPAGESWRVRLSSPGDQAGGSVALEVRFEPADNDSFVLSHTLAGLPAATAFRTICGSREPGEPSHGTSGNLLTWWWRWTAVESGHVAVFVAGAPGGSTLAVYEDTGGLDTLVPVTDQSKPAAQRVFAARAGQDYAMVLASPTASVQPARLEVIGPPANDDFARAENLAPLPRRVSGHTIFAEAEPGEPRHFLWFDDPMWGSFYLTGLGQSVWWQWTAPTDGILSLEGQGDTVLANLYAGESLDALARVEPLGNRAASRWRATAGRTYRLAFDNAWTVLDPHAPLPQIEGSPFTFTADFTSIEVLAPTPLSDLTAGEPVTFTASEPAVEVDGHLDALAFEVSPARDRLFAFDSLEYLVVTNRPWTVTFLDWPAGRFSVRAVTTNDHGVKRASPYASFRVHAPGDAFARRPVAAEGESLNWATLAGAGLEPGEPAWPSGVQRSLWWQWTATNDTRMALVPANRGEPIHWQVFAGTALADLQPASPRSPETVTFPGIAGRTYAIAATDAPGASSRIEAAFRLFSQPPNDAYANRTALALGDEGSRTWLYAATTEPGEDRLPEGEQPGVWWHWTAADEGQLALRLYGPDGVRRLQLFRGSTLDQLQLVAEATTDRLSALVHANQSYAVALRGTGGEVGLYARFLPGGGSDAFADRPSLTGDFLRVAGAEQALTAESGEALPFGEGSLWWSWTARADGWVAVLFALTGGTPTGDRLDLLAGDSLPELRAVPRHGIRGYPVQAGVRYSIRKTIPFFAPIPDHELTIEFTPLLSTVNDAYADRLVIEGDSASVRFDEEGATLEPAEPNHGLAGSLWWSWTAPSTGPVCVTVSGMASGLGVVVYPGDPWGGAAPLAFNDEMVSVTAGITYAIATGPLAPGSTQQRTLTIQAVPWVANDTYDGRIHLEGETAIIEGTSVDATVDAFEQRYVWRPAVWFDWTAPRTGRAEFSGLGTTDVWVFEVPVPGEWTLVGVNLGFPAQAGRTYAFLVVPSVSAPFAVRLAMEPPGPANDAFAGRIHLERSHELLTGTLLGATWEPHPRELWMTRDVWWTWTAPFGGELRLSPQPSAEITSISAWTGPDSASLQLLASSNEALSVPVVAGRTYHLRIGGGSPAPFAYRLELAPPADLGFVRAQWRDGGFELEFAGPPDTLVILEDSPDLADWTTLEAFQLTSGNARFLDLAAPRSSRRFYRLVPLR